MNSTARHKTEEHLQIETLLNRLPLTHPQRNEIHEQFLKQSAGYYGETNTDHYLRYLPKETYHTLHDVRLFDGIQHFQMDALVVTPELLILLEVKNYKGKLVFDFDHNQLFREFNGIQDLFPDPFLQVEHQTIQLSRWLGMYGFPEIPISSLIIVASSKTEIETYGKDFSHLKKRIVRPKNLISRVEQVRKDFSEIVLGGEDIRALLKRFKREHVPYKSSLMERYGLKMGDLILGVQCPQCSHFKMERRRDHWRCSCCGEKSMDAHLRALKDYQLLLGKEITNAEFRIFAQIPSAKVARRLLCDCCTHNNMHSKARVYTINLVK
ncbi:nuclease-related domain-containing protein [Halobacillus mangrovi]|uniref:nuclease-related domain-containing protein n=1 Tax=Halobacillus mangrovi TaxID=402384 RepID=UPI003D964B2C